MGGSTYSANAKLKCIGGCRRRVWELCAGTREYHSRRDFIFSFDDAFAFLFFFNDRVQQRRAYDDFFFFCRFGMKIMYLVYALTGQIPFRIQATSGMCNEEFFHRRHRNPA